MTDFTEVCELKKSWDTMMKDQLSKVLSLREYIYNQEVEEGSISPGGDLKNIEPATLSSLRPALNRIKTDVRDIQATIRAHPRKPQKNDSVSRLFEQLLNSYVLNNSNHKELYKAFDSILDMSYCILKIRTKNKFDEVNQKISTTLDFENVPDIQDVFFDTRVPLGSVNKDGKFVGYHKIIQEDDRPIELWEFWKKVYKKVTYGIRRSEIDPSKLITEKARNKVQYITKVKVDEVDYVSHEVWKNKELTSEIWPYKSLPFIIGLGVFIDDFTEDYNPNFTNDGKRVCLTPFAEHVKKPQMTLDYAASLQMQNIKMSRGTTKFMIPHGLLSEEFSKIWNNRNTTDDDLPYIPMRDSRGNMITDLKPMPVPDVPISPAISEVVQGYPVLINSLLGTNLEQDVTYNASGEAIRQMRVISHKNAKLYTDSFLSLLDDVGKALNSYIPILFGGEQFVTIDNNGTPKNLLINTSEGIGHPPMMVDELVKTHKIIFSAGRNRISSDEQNRLALEELYRVTSSIPELGANVISATLDIYADSLDAPSSADISQRISLFIPPQIRDLSQGKVTVEEIEQNQRMQQMEAQQLQKQMQAQQLNMANQKLSADQLEAQARVMKANADKENAEARVVESHEKLRATELKTNAEIAKSFREDK